jgi:hypothetical protein
MVHQENQIWGDKLSDRLCLETLKMFFYEHESAAHVSSKNIALLLKWLYKTSKCCCFYETIFHSQIPRVIVISLP